MDLLLNVSLDYKNDYIKHQYLPHVNFVYDANHVLVYRYDVCIHLDLNNEKLIRLYLFIQFYLS